MLAQVTGGTPKTAGLFYDDSYDRTEYPSKAFYTSQGMPDPGCTGTAGAELTNFEELDKSYNFATALVADYTGGGTLGQVYTQLDPDNMQRQLVDGKCVPVYPARVCPHQHDLRNHQGRRPPNRLVRQAPGLRGPYRPVRQGPRRTVRAGDQFAGHARSRRAGRRRLHHQLHRRSDLRHAEGERRPQLDRRLQQHAQRPSPACRRSSA